MSTITLQDNTVKTRKDHWCETCGWIIRKGHLAKYLVSIVDGKFCHGWFHYHDCKEN